mgnify:CR=1 FL=1
MIVAGYPVVGRRYPRSARSFVQRSSMRGRPWLVFLAKCDGSGDYWVTAHRTLRQALEG